MTQFSRRTVLTTGVGVFVGLAGCQGDGASTASPGETTTGQASRTDTAMDSRTTGVGTATDEPATTADELDLREANVTAVEFEPQGGGSYRFSVTLYHDDDGEDGYANWWQVERPDGTQLGRRKLVHAHSTDPFTRSETIDVPEDVNCVVVRGHDQTHGYGGHAAVVSLDTASVGFLDQGSERHSISESACP